MEKYFMLNRSPYHDINAIRVHSRYRKGKGYYIEAEMVTRNNGMIGKSFCREYYQHNGDGIAHTIPAGRKSAKREAEAADYCSQNARSIAEKFLQHVIDALQITDDIHIIEEAEE